jgi:hypothetical protein
VRMRPYLFLPYLYLIPLVFTPPLFLSMRIVLLIIYDRTFRLVGNDKGSDRGRLGGKEQC